MVGLLPNARSLTAVDLARSGWRLSSEEPTACVGIADGKPFRAAELSGVLCLMPAVMPSELAFIEAHSRDYVAQEMTAFLRYFLTSLRCPVVNRPTAGSLCGPAWRRERWLQVAATVGVPIEPYRRSTRMGQSQGEPTPASEVRTLTLIGREVLEPGFEELAPASRAIARVARVDLLQLQFAVLPHAPARFMAANPRPVLAGDRSGSLLSDIFRTDPIAL